MSANLTLDFPSPPGPTLNASLRPSNVPIVSNGFMWGNLVDRAWLFGGKALDGDVSLDNDVWRFAADGDGVQWTQLAAGDNITDSRPSHGAGCNVPDLRRGFYLGGMTSDNSTTGSPTTYLH
jgi:hypothetical protein